MNTRDLHSTLTQLWDYRWKKKNTRNIIWDMTLTICYICFNKQQVQQLIHNDKTTMSSLYPLVCAFLLECSFASNICFHTSHTLQQTFIWIYIYIPLTFPLPKRLFPVRWFWKSLEPPHPWSSESAPHILWSFGPFFGERWPWMGIRKNMIKIC